MKKEEPTTVEIGHKDGRVIINFYGTSEVAQSYIAWSPREAREVARLLLKSADDVDAAADVRLELDS